MALEGIVGAIQDAIEAVVPEYSVNILPFVASLWIFLVLANLVGIIPACMLPRVIYPRRPLWASWFFFPCIGMAFGFMVSRQYLRHYIEPNPILLPFHIVSEVSRTVALAVRLFGNIFSLEMAALVGSARSRISGAGAGIIAAYRRGFGASLYIWDAGTDLYCRWNPVVGAQEKERRRSRKCMT